MGFGQIGILQLRVLVVNNAAFNFFLLLIIQFNEKKGTSVVRIEVLRIFFVDEIASNNTGCWRREWPIESFRFWLVFSWISVVAVRRFLSGAVNRIRRQVNVTNCERGNRDEFFFSSSSSSPWFTDASGAQAEY